MLLIAEINRKFKTLLLVMAIGKEIDRSLTEVRSADIRRELSVNI